jgi:hypothetical protein
MPKQKKLPPELQAWVDARRRFHLSHAQIQMARELGINPKKLGGMAITGRSRGRLHWRSTSRSCTSSDSRKRGRTISALPNR